MNTKLVALLALPAAFGAWVLIGTLVAKAAQSEPCQSVLQRLRKVQVGTPFDSEKLPAGDATYEEQVHIAPGDGQAKVQVRTEQRYAGPMPLQDELRCLLDRGVAHALVPLLREPLRTELRARMKALEQSLGQLARDIDLETERAKGCVLGTADELAIDLKHPGALKRKSEVMTLVRAAKRSEERHVAEVQANREVWFRLRKASFPKLFDMHKAQQEALALRREFLEAQTRDVLERHGLAALDPARFAPPAGGR